MDLDELIPPRPAWMADAACREHPGVEFVPSSAVDAGPALDVCAGCLVSEECLTFAKANGECGVWGGRLLRVPKPPAPSARRRRDADIEALAVRAAGWRRKAEAARAKRSA